MSKEVMQQAQLLCEWIAETPHQRGSINGLAAQVLHSISAALAAAQPAQPAESEGDVQLRACEQSTGREYFIKSGPRAAMQAEADKMNEAGHDYFVLPKPAPQPEKRFTGLILSEHRDPMNGASIPNPFKFGAEPQPAQEPVLFIHPATFAMESVHVGAWKPGHELPGYFPLYTTPQAPQRQPLTVAEVEQILAQWNYELHGDRARYIVRETEAAHGIK